MEREERGFLGIARDLLAALVERGLNLPNAADLIRSMPVSKNLAPRVAPLPTVTLAEIYVQQGHRSRAIHVLERIIERDPENARAIRLLEELEPHAPVPDSPVIAPEESMELAVASAIESSPLVNPMFDRSACVALVAPGEPIFVMWHVRQVDIEADDELGLRVLTVHSSWDGPRCEEAWFALSSLDGSRWLAPAPVAAVVRVALARRNGTDTCVLATSPSIETCADTPLGFVRWTTGGPLPIRVDDDDYAVVSSAAKLRLSLPMGMLRHTEDLFAAHG